MKAAIFDMDGLLIDSEPLWQEAEITVFGSVGVPLTREMCRQTMGLRLDAVVRRWYERFPWTGESLKSVETRVLEEVAHLIVSRGQPMPGVHEAIDCLTAAGYKLAVASSSPLKLIQTAMETFELTERFAILHSAEAEKAGKPHPAVYNSAMSRLGAEPQNCIAFEDSVIGVRSAKDAGAWVIAVPDVSDIGHPEFALADLVLPSLADFSLTQVP